MTGAVAGAVPILTFARLTIWEAARRRLLIALVLLTLAIIVATSFGFSRLWTITNGGVPIGEVEVRLIASQLLVVVTFMFSFVLALSSVMVAAPSISGDVESGLVLSLLARPVRRFDVTLGSGSGSRSWSSATRPAREGWSCWASTSPPATCLPTRSSWSSTSPARGWCCSRSASCSRPGWRE